MKASLHILLLLAYAFLAMRPSVPLLEYELRQGFIASEYCVNQDKPEMKCDGKCYLNKRLAEAADEPSDPSAVSLAPSLPIHLAAEEDDHSLLGVFISQNSNSWLPELTFRSDQDAPPSPPPEALT